MGNQPNVILILVDDLGWRDLGCYGSDFYETPHIDRLAEEGMRFTDAYAASPVCSPSRASLMTGKYPARIGVTHYSGAPEERGRLVSAPYVDHLPLSEHSLARAMGDGGYATWLVGKWHLGGRDTSPECHGFQVNIGGCHFSHPYHGYFAPWGIEALDEGEDGEYLTDRLTDEAITLIRDRPADAPFFLMLSHYAVHIPIQAKEEDIRYFREKAQRMGRTPENSLLPGEEFPCEHLRGRHVVRRISQSCPEYAAMIYDLDRNTGRLMQCLKEEGIHDDTIVIFTSDNGGLSSSEGSPTCNSPLAEGKGWMYEGGLRVPLIVWKPDQIRRGAVSHTPVITPDLYPTLLKLAQLPLLPGQHQDGLDLTPLLFERDIVEREAVYWHFPHYGNQGGTPSCAVRWAGFVLIRFFEGRYELYNMETDISQCRNLYDERSDIAGKLKDLLEQWLISTSANLPGSNNKEC